MAEKELDAKLAGYLILVFLEFDFTFVHDFHSTKKTCLLVLDQHYLTELTFAHFFAYLEIRLRKHLRRRLDFWFLGNEGRNYGGRLRVGARCFEDIFGGTFFGVNA